MQRREPRGYRWFSWLQVMLALGWGPGPDSGLHSAHTAVLGRSPRPPGTCSFPANERFALIEP